MDRALLTWFNQTLSHPLLDKLMLGATSGGLMLFPLSGIILWIKQKRKIASAIFIAQILALAIALIFQWLGQRARPDSVRLITAVPDYPSYPSGHVALVFSAATILSLTYRQSRWIGLSMISASFITISRVYLGLHYPSDVIAGAVIGVATGAACYGLIVQEQPQWHWLLWPQIALIFIATQMAYLDILPKDFLSWPFADKVMHFLLFGGVVFWLNLWLNGRAVKLWRWKFPVALLILLVIAVLEEGAQAFSPHRSVDAVDLASGVMGIIFFWKISEVLRTRDQAAM